jgi:hypothetical protein
VRSGLRRGAHQHDGAQGFRQPLGDGNQRRQHHGIHEDKDVLRVLQDIGDLVGEEARVHRVQHRAHARDGVVELQVLARVPAEGRDPVAGPHAEPDQRLGEFPSAFRDLGPGGARDGALGIDGDDLRAAVVLRRVAQDRRDEELVLLHQAAHGNLPGKSFVGSIMAA